MEKLQVVETRTVLGKELRVYGTVEEPLFLAKDVAEWLGINKPNEMIRNVDEDEKLKAIVSLSGQGRGVWVLKEQGIYEVLFQSRKDIAKQFKKEVKKILKEIRLKGFYVAQQATTKQLEQATQQIEDLMAEKKLEELLRQSLIQNVEELEQQNTELKIKYSQFNSLMKKEDMLTLSEVAKELGFKTVKDLKDAMVRVGVLTKEERYIVSDNYKYLVNHGLMQYQVHTYDNTPHEHLKVAPKSVDKLRKKLEVNGEINVRLV